VTQPAAKGQICLQVAAKNAAARRRPLLACVMAHDLKPSLRILLACATPQTQVYENVRIFKFHPDDDPAKIAGRRGAFA
jgi:hypothetical protein